MKSKALWRVSLLILAEAESAASEVMADLLQSEPVIFFDCETRLSTLTVYLPDPRLWTPKLRAGLRARVAELKQFGLDPGPARLRFEKVRRQDWAESWKRHFKPLRLGHHLLVRPSWAKPAGQHEVEVVLDPGLSFGTGHHPTTEFCLRQLAALRSAGHPCGMLDIGTGTGILAIAAAKLGYSPVAAFDFDPEAVEVAEGNARNNRVLDKIKLSRRDLTRLPRKSATRYQVLCANLTANLLVAELDRILARLKPGGFLILAGILAAEFLTVQAACERAGLRLIKARTQKEWRSGLFASPPTVRG